MICQLPFDELTPEEKVRESEREERRLAAKAQEEAIEGNTPNKNNLKKISPNNWFIIEIVHQTQRPFSLKQHF
jgi:hypothetical protein